MKNGVLERVVEMKDERLEKLAQVLVEYSTHVQPGDTVCISAEDGALPFISAVARAAVKQGGIVKYYVDLPDVDAEILRNGNDTQIAQPNERFGHCAQSDVWISAWGSRNTKTMANIDGEKLKLRRLANKENRKVYSSRMGDGSLRWVGTQFPTEGDAQAAGMSLEEYEDFVYRAGFLHEADPVAKWQEMAQMQEKWIAYLNQKKELHIVAEGTDLTVGIAGRKWIGCSGQENYPDGEIFTSPVEDAVNGVITFSYPAILNGHAFPKVCLKVEQGRIIEATCADAAKNERLLSYIDTDEGSRYFGEVAIGTNYGIQQFTENILFDEKIGGSMHMAIGEAFQEAGGKNESAIHWDMINNMCQGGKIYTKGKLFYENGQFLWDVLEK